MWDSYHKKRTLNGTVPEGLPRTPMYSFSSGRPPTRTQWDQWWSRAHWSENESSYINPDYDYDYFRSMLRGWYRHSTPAQRERIVAFRRSLERTTGRGSRQLNRREWDELRRQIFYSFNDH